MFCRGEIIQSMVKNIELNLMEKKIDLCELFEPLSSGKGVKKNNHPPKPLELTGNVLKERGSWLD